MIKNQEFIDTQMPDSTNYQKFLLEWIMDLGLEIKDNFNYDSIKNVSIGIYLLCKDLHIENITEDNKFILYFNNKYGYGKLIYKLVKGIANSNPDLFEVLSEIKDNYFNTEFMSWSDFKLHLYDLYDLEKISEEENNETLIFGDNVLNNEITVRELADQLRMISEEFIKDHIPEINSDITFAIPESSILYLKDTEGIQLCLVNLKEKGNRYIVRYSNDQGSALFVLFNFVSLNNETIYGLSLDTNNLGERGLLVIEKNKDGYNYKFLFGRGDF